MYVIEIQITDLINNAICVSRKPAICSVSEIYRKFCLDVTLRDNRGLSNNKVNLFLHMVHCERCCCTRGVYIYGEDSRSIAACVSLDDLDAESRLRNGLET